METTLLNKSTLFKRMIALGDKIGNTPLIPVVGLHRNNNVKIFAKVEWAQLSGSIKARAAYNIIRHAIEHRYLDENNVLLDATSGNTGIAYAYIARELGLRISLCLPENASKERKAILESLGVKIIYTSKFGGTDEAQEHAAEIAHKFPKRYFYANQYSNEQNWKAHYMTTAPEIFGALPEITHFVAGLGTTGTFIGTSRKLKELNPAIKTFSLQPDFALHGLEGWKHLETAIVPKIYAPEIADGNLEISTLTAYRIIKDFNLKEGLLLSPSSAANLAGAIQIANEIEKGVIVTVLPDNADKYSEIIHKIL
jgi:cysteine synthase B